MLRSRVAPESAAGQVTATPVVPAASGVASDPRARDSSRSRERELHGRNFVNRIGFLLSTILVLFGVASSLLLWLISVNLVWCMRWARSRR